jgi:hypothetical protein
MIPLQVFNVGRSGGMAAYVMCFGGQRDSDNDSENYSDNDSTRNNRAVFDSRKRPNTNDMGQDD